MGNPQVDLAALFSAVTKALQENQQSLNAADEYNNDHGDNMVRNFQLITKAVKSKKGASPSEQLSYASNYLQEKSQSGSARMYSQGLSQAASQLQGQDSIDSRNALSLVQGLLGGKPPASSAQAGSGDVLGQLLGSMLSGSTPSQPAPQPGQGADAMGDLMGGLLGSLMGGGQAASPASQPPASPGSDMLGELMGALLGGGTTGKPPQTPPGNQPSGGLDLNTLLQLGSSMMGSSQQGASPVGGLLNVLLSGSQMNDTPHHSQSGQLVASTLINVLGTMLGGKRR